MKAIDEKHRAFSPVPKHVMDGSEPGDVTPAAVLSGAPVELQARVARYDMLPCSRTYLYTIQRSSVVHRPLSSP